MIAEAEIRRYAAQWGVDPMVVDLDYVAALYRTTKSADLLRFKGGTCLRKCYFADYRFSEDMDFSATAALAPDALMGWVERATRWAADHDGPDFVAAPARFEVIEDEYGSESYQVRVYYRGPLRWSGSPRAIRLDVTRAERLLLPAASRRLIHIYSDAEALGQLEIACYALDEVLAEKIRALGSQRRFAISRDVYDVHQLLQAGVSVAEVAPLLPAKLAARGIDVAALSVERMLENRAQFEQDWQRRLSYLVPNVDAVTFAAAWQSAVRKGHISTLHLWWARRPLVACRAAVYGALVPAPATPRARRERAEFVAALCTYPGPEEEITAARRHILEAHTVGLPGGASIAHKHGWVDDTRADAALVFTPGGDYVLAIYLYHPGWVDWEQTNSIMTRISQLVYAFFNPPPTS